MKDVGSDMGRTVPQRRTNITTAIGSLALGVLAGCASDGAHPLPGDGPNATVVRVIDGDTIEVDVAGRRERVRLLGIDTPEIPHAAGDDRPATPGECFGDEATAFAADLLPAGTQVRLERDVVGRDHYDRILAHVYRDAVHVNLELVRQGFATPLTIEPNGVHRGSIVAAATAAEQADVGLWSTCQ